MTGNNQYLGIKMQQWFKSYILPGLIFQSALVGGAYGSGQELAEFFLPFGPGGGLLGIGISTILFSLVLAASYEFSRVFRLYDYRSFCKGLLGRFWPIYEILFVLVMVLIISVVGAASGRLFETTFALPAIVGTIGIVVLIALLVFFGNKGMERALALWSFVLYGAYGLFLYWNINQFGEEIRASISIFEVKEGWGLSGLKYAGYNLALVPILLFVIRHLKTRREAVGAGLIAGLIGMVPAGLFYLAMIGQYDILLITTDLPVTVLLNALDGAELFGVIFPVVLFGTFIETGAALVHGLNERVASVYEERNKALPNIARPIIAICVLFVSIVLADIIGLNKLISQGYGMITYGFLLVFVVPVLTWGVWKIYKAEG
jgi:uncharacterized membrane protein YkvI